MQKENEDIRALCDAIDNLVCNRTDVVPKGWHTTKQIAEARKCSIPTAQRAIQDLIKDGFIETRKFTIKAGNRILPVAHFRYHAKKK